MFKFEIAVIAKMPVLFLNGETVSKKDVLNFCTVNQRDCSD